MTGSFSSWRLGMAGGMAAQWGSEHGRELRLLRGMR